MTQFSHIPVLLDEAIEQLNVSSGKKYIDATLGGGGHTSLILQCGGLVFGIDQDTEALEYVRQSQKSEVRSQNLKVVHGNFRDIKTLAENNGFGTVDGILFDLGVSSYQLDSSTRGFSFKKEERLDMRMDRTRELDAYYVINSYPREKLIEIFYTFGEEHNAKEVARSIVEQRKKHEITTTKELAGIIEKISHKSEAIHPATRIFQAIRIEVNGELEALKSGLRDSVSLLQDGGRLVVISFHSLEDRIVKQMFEKMKREGLGTLITKKPITAGLSEIQRNKRARSAKMRVFERV